MIVAQPLRGRDPVLLNPRSRTLYNPVSAAQIEALRADLENPRLQASPLFRGGLGSIDIPPLAMYGGIGLLAGIAVGAAIYFVGRR